MSIISKYECAPAFQTFGKWNQQEKLALGFTVTNAWLNSRFYCVTCNLLLLSCWLLLNFKLSTVNLFFWPTSLQRYLLKYSEPKTGWWEKSGIFTNKYWVHCLLFSLLETEKKKSNHPIVCIWLLQWLLSCTNNSNVSIQEKLTPRMIIYIPVVNKAISHLDRLFTGLQQVLFIAICVSKVSIPCLFWEALTLQMLYIQTWSWVESC